GLFNGRVNSKHLRPLLRFGAGWVVGMAAVVLLVNLDKLFLARMVSVTSLAHYSVAFLFANTATLFGSAMAQSMVPAFSQLSSPEKKGEFDALFARAVRLNLIWVFPMVAFLFVIGRPFFTLWAGPEFGEESTLPFYILLVGLIFIIPSFVPYASIMAMGRTDKSAKLYWIELLVYVAALIVLINYFGIAGAALAWTLRALIETTGLFFISRRLNKVTLATNQKTSMLLLSLVVLTVPVLLSLVYQLGLVVSVSLTLICIALYATIVWYKFMQTAERDWIAGRIVGFLGKSGLKRDYS
ncbi:MAG TPA: oligosaccharide flippase family protein, partial [Pyrinomonadaceae bacterium]|nr:oligosaccharide flippase family protein [Pyrinomonadaceae bacterium]